MIKILFDFLEHVPLYLRTAVVLVPFFLIWVYIVFKITDYWERERNDKNEFENYLKD